MKKILLLSVFMLTCLPYITQAGRFIHGEYISEQEEAFWQKCYEKEDKERITRQREEFKDLIVKDINKNEDRIEITYKPVMKSRFDKYAVTLTCKEGKPLYLVFKTASSNLFDENEFYEIKKSESTDKDSSYYLENVYNDYHFKGEKVDILNELLEKMNDMDSLPDRWSDEGREIYNKINN